MTGPISCGQAEGGFVDLTGLAAGPHTLRIDAWQLGGLVYGVMYGGSVNSAADPVPEPGTVSYTLLFIAGAGVYLGAKSGRFSSVRK